MYDIEQTGVFIRWLAGLKDSRARARIRARIERAGLGAFGDWSPEGGKLRAMRIDYGPGYRLYYTIHGGKLVILLCGGVKRTQQADIEKARAIFKEL